MNDTRWHAWQDDLDKWARDNLPSESAGCISSWSDHIARFIVSRLDAQSTSSTQLGKEWGSEMSECPYCGGDERKCDFSFETEVCSQMTAAQDNRACVVLADGSILWDTAAMKQGTRE